MPVLTCPWIFQRLRRGRCREDHPRGQGGERTIVIDRMVAAFGMVVARIGPEAGPLSQWLYAEMKAAGLAVELLETRHVRDAFKAMPVKTDRKDARGIAQLMRLGWFLPVHCKSLPAPGGAGAADHA
jgi:transposase